MEKQAVFLGVERDRTISPETDRPFWALYQGAILLALRERGILTEQQYRYGAERLRKAVRSEETEAAP